MAKKKISFCTFLILLFIPPVFSLGALDEVNAKISHVRLYQDSALVRRKASLSVKNLNGKFVLKSLPETLTDKSITIFFQDPGAGVKIHKVIVKRQVEKSYQNEDAKKALEGYNAILLKLRLLNQEYTALVKHRATVAALKPEQKIGIQGTKSEVEIETEVWSAFREMTKSLYESAKDAELEKLLEIDAVREDLIVAEARLDYYKNAVTTVKKNIEVEYTATKKGEFPFQVEYFVSGAEWYPRYSAKVSPETKENNFHFYALVRNNTGEDWKNVSIDFSAADPFLSQDVPVLKEWRVGVVEREILREAEEESRPNKKRKGKQLNQLSKKSEAPMPAQKPMGGLDRKEMADGKIYNQDESADYDSPKSEEKRDYANYDKINDAVQMQSVTKEILNKNIMQSRSIQTEEQISQLRSDYNNMRYYFRNKNYSSAMDYSKQAKLKMLKLSEKQRKELILTSNEIDDIAAKSSFLYSNSKLSENLIPPRNSSGGFDYRYSAKGAETVLSDNSFNKIMISSDSIPSAFQFESSPISKKSVFLTTTSKVKSKEPLLSGPVDLFIKENYLGTSSISMTVRGEDLKFDLGPDEDIEVERRETSFREKKGLISEKNAIRHKVEIILKNKKAEPVEVKVIDRVPYTIDSKVSIDTEYSNPKPKIGKEGILVYQLKLKAKENITLDFSYTVSYPSKNLLRESQGGGE